METGLTERGIDGRWGERGGRPALLGFGALEAEARALREGAGLLVRAGQATVRVTGADRVDYLHRMLSQDVRRIRDGEAAWSCLLTPKGRVVADPVVWNLGAWHVLDLDAAALAPALERLARYVITEDVAFEDRTTETARLALLGPRAPEVLEGLGGTAPQPWEHRTVVLAGVEVHLLRRDVGDRPGFELMAPAARARALFDALRGASAVTAVGEDAFDVLRVEEGLPAFGAELDERALPNEARLDDVALSWSKGCYPGQEPVVMAKHRGHPASLLVRLALEVAAGEPPPAGAALQRDGREAGRLTTVAHTAAGLQALGYVRHAEASEGNVLEVEGMGRARVLPWA